MHAEVISTHNFPLIYLISGIAYILIGFILFVMILRIKQKGYMSSTITKFIGGCLLCVSLLVVGIGIVQTNFSYYSEKIVKFNLIDDNGKVIRTVIGYYNRNGELTNIVMTEE